MCVCLKANLAYRKHHREAPDYRVAGGSLRDGDPVEREGHGSHEDESSDRSHRELLSAESSALCAAWPTPARGWGQPRGRGAIRAAFRGDVIRWTRPS